MKNLKYLLVILIAFTTTVSCVEDDIIEKDLPPVIGSVLKLNEIMSKDVDPKPDWIEVYNSGDDDMDISGFILNDKDVADGGFAIPDGTIINSHGFYVVDQDESGIKVSSGGEDVSLSKPDGTVIDYIFVPDMASNVGLTWGREIDGEGDWMISNATPGASNGSAENVPPILDANPLTEFDDVYAVSASDADGVASVKLIHMINDGVQSIDMALVDGEYKTTVPRAKVGDVVKYYVVATDNTGLQTYYPENGNNEPAEFTVAGGLEELNIAGAEAGFRGEVKFTATPYYPGQVDEIRLYYLKDGEQQDEDNGFDDKHKVVLDQDGDNYVGVVPEQETDDVIAYYLRVEYVDGTKTYYPLEVEDAEGNVISDFNHDLGTTWPTYTVEAISYDPVVDQTVTYTDGPLTSVVFPTNPVPGTDFNVVLAYTSTDVIGGARIYFDVGDAPVYVKGNKVKGEDDASFTQTGVTINLKDVVAENGLIISDTGNKTTFYIRMATEDASGNDIAEYYYGSDGSMYLDDTPGGGTTDQSDAFKGDTSLWNVLNVQ
ncbi:MAG: lamin tail domain-containing protein [Flavobacteriaceae bacterium]|nr:lamin tail domain-containing protein [Flavobacteriaceae bacterium]